MTADAKSAATWHPDPPPAGHWGYDQHGIFRYVLDGPRDPDRLYPDPTDLDGKCD